MKVRTVRSVPPLIDWKTELQCVGEKILRTDPKGCGAPLHVTFRDLVLMKWHGIRSAEYYAGTKCVKCGKYNSVRIPDPIWKIINTKKNRAQSIFDGFDILVV